MRSLERRIKDGQVNKLTVSSKANNYLGIIGAFSRVALPHPPQPSNVLWNFVTVEKFETRSVWESGKFQALVNL